MSIPNMTLDEFAAVLAQHGLLDDTRLLTAVGMAIESYEGLTRDDGSDVLSQHIFPMTASLIDYYSTPERRVDIDVLIGSLLHDILEDVKNSDPLRIRQLFGDKVHNIVYALSKRKIPGRKGYHIYGKRVKYNRDYYKQIASSSEDVKTIKAADRLNNLQCAYSNPDKSKVDNYIRETEEFYLGIFSELPYYHEKITQELTRLRARQARRNSGGWAHRNTTVV